MGHNVGDAAAEAVKKSKPKEEKKLRTDEQILKDIQILLDARLAVPPNDVRLLLQKYKEAENAVHHLGQATSALLKRAETAEAEVAARTEMKQALPLLLGLLNDPEFVKGVLEKGFEIRPTAIESMVNEGGPNGN